MSFVWPQLLWLLLVLPLLVGAYVLILRRKKIAIRYSSLALVKEAVGAGPQVRRHIPPLLLLAALAMALLAVARPTATITLPSQQQTIVLALDVSLSMRAMDIEPNRLEAAQAAARDFVRELPKDVRMALVSFAGTASVVQPPTHNRDDLIAAIDRLQMQRQTAIGSGIIVSLATLFPERGIDLEAAVFDPKFSRSNARRPLSEAKEKAKAQETFAPVPPGSYKPAAIILLTDGRRTTGPDPRVAAKMAADHGVRVFTVGFGSARGGAVAMGGYSYFMQFDEETLKAVAEITRAEYFHAASAAELKKVYSGLNSRFALEKQRTEITALLTAAAAVLAALAAALSLLWFHRPA